jgi:two-component system OmpR family sensor kinase
MAAGRRDITVPIEGPAEVAEVAEAVLALAASLAVSEARQREFLLAVSHDLRTPLTSITGYAESLADGVVGPDEAANAGAVMLGEARRLERLVADLLDLARLEAQEFRVDLVDIDPAALLREAGAVWSARCAAAGVRFEVYPSESSLVLHSDPLRIRQIVDGLLENALRLTPAGQPIVLASRREGPGDWVVFEVRDGGPGLTDADLAVAFDRFTLYERYRGVRQVGTGLGLTIVQRLAERLGGTVSAGHAPEGGARFTVRLPRAGTAALPVGNPYTI